MVHSAKPSQDADIAYNKYTWWKDSKLTAACGEVFKKYKEIFRPADASHASCNKLSEYDCSRCGYKFKTHLNAMIDHAEDHLTDRYTLIGKTSFGSFVPERHYYCNSLGDFRWLPDTKVFNCHFPTGIKFRKGYLGCRFCSSDKHKIEWGSTRLGTISKKVRFKRLKKLRDHEDICREAGE